MLERIKFRSEVITLTADNVFLKRKQRTYEDEISLLEANARDLNYQIKNLKQINLNTEQWYNKELQIHKRKQWRRITLGALIGVIIGVTISQ